MKNRLQDYTESEFLQLLLASEELDFSDEGLDDLVNFFNEKVDHPKGSALLTHPTMLGIEDSSEAIIEELKRWYTEKGQPCFKDQPI
ncbi:bacteriocin immunity protein [Vibrio rotiferianus]